jgi:hypothetical protein
LRYGDAVKMLGGGESKLLAFLDDASSVALMGLDTFDLFEAKAEAVRLADKVLKGFGQKLRGLNALSRTERLTVAHWIIIITAFFEALDEHLKAVGIDDLGASAAEQVVLITGSVPGETSLIGVGRALATPVPMPDVHALYVARSERLLDHLQGHRFRIADGHPTANPAQEEWWRQRPVHDDLGLYLASHLVSEAAQRAPLLVLGHPGSGKSVLTRVLAARLPADQFLPAQSKASPIW